MSLWNFAALKLFPESNSDCNTSKTKPLYSPHSLCLVSVPVKYGLSSTKDDGNRGWLFKKASMESVIDL